jgi:hypothetical protein
MKKLTTITELDLVDAEVKGTIKIDELKDIHVLPNGKASPEAALTTAKRRNDVRSQLQRGPHRSECGSGGA